MDGWLAGDGSMDGPVSTLEVLQRTRAGEPLKGRTYAERGPGCRGFLPDQRMIYPPNPSQLTQTRRGCNICRQKNEQLL